jgi:glutaminase
MMNGDPAEAVDRYTKACSVMVTTKQLALMGATLANKGINPITHEQVFTPQIVRDILSEMTVNGLYENSGNWWSSVGIPAKGGVGGGILAVIPNKMAIAVFSPPLDTAGNSVRAQLVITDISKQWKLHMLDG